MGAAASTNIIHRNRRSLLPSKSSSHVLRNSSLEFVRSLSIHGKRRNRIRKMSLSSCSVDSTECEEFFQSIRTPRSENDFNYFKNQIPLYPIELLPDAFEQTSENEILCQNKKTSVCMLRKKASSDIFALKIGSKNDMKNEMEILQRLDHVGIAKLYCSYFDAQTKNVSMVLEYGAGGDLHRLMDKNNKKNFSELQIRDIVLQMLNCLQYLHSKFICHCDVKLENWVFANEYSDRILLIDFGLSCNMKNYREGIFDTRGTLFYLAPEVVDKNGYSYGCDMWSLGVLTYIMGFRKMPFKGPDAKSTMNAICNDPFQFPSNDLSPAFRSFITRLLEKNPENRMTCSVALRHEFILSTATSIEPNTSFQPPYLIESLRHFAQQKPLKRLCTVVVAYEISNKVPQFMIDMFKYIDHDNFGTVTVEKLRRVLPLSSIADEELDDLFQIVDYTGRGKLELSEVLAVLLKSAHFDLVPGVLKDVFHKIEQRFDDDMILSFEACKKFFGRGFESELPPNTDGINYMDFETMMKEDSVRN